MKRYLISMTVVLVVLLAAWTVFAQEAGKGTPAGEGARGLRPIDVNRPALPEGRPARPRGMGMDRGEQMKAVAAIEEQVAKLKALIEAQPGTEEFAKMNELSEEERTKMRDKFAKARAERQNALDAIEQNIAKLRGGRPRVEPQQLVDELQAIRDMAKEEKAEQTANRIEQLLERQKGLEGRLPRPPAGTGIAAPPSTPALPVPPPPPPEPNKPSTK